MADEAATPLLGAAADELGVGNVLLNVLPVTKLRATSPSIFSRDVGVVVLNNGARSALGADAALDLAAPRRGRRRPRGAQ